MNDIQDQFEVVPLSAYGKQYTPPAGKVDPDFDPKFGQLVDFSKVDDFKITPIGIQMLVSRDPWDAGARRAFVAPSDISFGMLRMHEFLMDDKSQQIIVFRSAIEANRSSRPRDAE